MSQLELQSLLAVHAHPDDETLSNGGLLAATAAAGLPTAVVTLTRGEQGEVIGPRKRELEGTGPVLAAFRTAELAGALGALGVQHHVFLDQIPGESTHRFEDSGMAWVNQELGAGHSAAAALGDNVPPGALVSVAIADPATRLAQVIIELAPHTVVTYEPGGGYGHPDHVRTHEITVAAIAMAARGIGGKRHQVQRFLWTVIPKEILQAGRGALTQARNVVADAKPEASYPGVLDPIASVGAWPTSAAQAVDIRPVLDNVVRALESHASQVQWVQRYDQPVVLKPDSESSLATDIELSGSYALSNNIVAPLLSHEFYLPAEVLRSGN